MPATLPTTWREVLAEHVTYSVRCEPEGVPIRGNVMASGDAAEDRAAEVEVRAQLAAGNEWAWCSVIVTCRLSGTELCGEDSLGCCSYDSEEDFMRCNGEDMKAEAFADLCRQVEPIACALGLV